MKIKGTFKGIKLDCEHFTSYIFTAYTFGEDDDSKTIYETPLDELFADNLNDIWEQEL